jgi:hypothetical protein
MTECVDLPFSFYAHLLQEQELEDNDHRSPGPGGDGVQ